MGGPIPGIVHPVRIEITGSRVHRVWKCPASAILPQVDQGDRNEPARRRGKQIHAYLERVRKVGVDSALAEQTVTRGEAFDLASAESTSPDGLPSPVSVQEILDGNAALLALLRALDIDELPTWLATEVSFAWDWRAKTARELGRNLDRAYPQLGKTEIACTLDIVGHMMNPATDRRAALVSDYKLGHTKYPAPDRFGQTLLGALCVSGAWDSVGQVAVELIHIHDNGDHHKVRRWIGDWELDGFADELEAAMLLVDHWEAEYAAGRGVNVNEGEWCTYCPAYNQCPAKVALVRSIPAELRALGVTQGSEGGPLVVDERGITVSKSAEYWMAVERIEESLRHIKQEICNMAAFEPVPLPDGRVIGLLRTERRTLDGRVAAEVLDAKYGRQERESTVEVSCSMDALRKCVVRNLKTGEKIQKKDGTGTYDRVLAEIERKGGLGINSTDSVKPHVPKKRLGSG